jgi:penicillin-binding protein 1A
LPICGNFIQSVLDDPAFKHYHAKFRKPSSEEVASGLYNCQSYYYSRSDTLDADTVIADEVDEMQKTEAAEPGTSSSTGSTTVLNEF